MKKPLKISYDELVSSMCMFWIDREFEESIEAEVQQNVADMVSNLSEINTLNGLKKYITENKDSLSNILVLLGISEERFKRVITMLRRDKRYNFSTEWSLSKTRTVMIENLNFMDEICELLMNGASLEKYNRKIPLFYRAAFHIDKRTVAKLKNIDELTRLAKDRLETKYNSGVLSRMLKRIEDTIKLTCDLNGIEYIKNKTPDIIQRQFAFVIPDGKTPRVLVGFSYNITTSSTQSKLKGSISETKEKLEEQKNDVITVNIIDGAGWLGRQSDLKDIYNKSDYVLNMANLGQLDEIIKFAFEVE